LVLATDGEWFMNGWPALIGTSIGFYPYPSPLLRLKVFAACENFPERGSATRSSLACNPIVGQIDESFIVAMLRLTEPPFVCGCAAQGLSVVEADSTANLFADFAAGG
jgi:hypothetical protein